MPVKETLRKTCVNASKLCGRIGKDLAVERSFALSVRRVYNQYNIGHIDYDFSLSAELDIVLGKLLSINSCHRN